MGDELALRRAVLASDSDDLPRQVYADWCEENGDPARAEFIRLQCRIAASACVDPEDDVLRHRARLLLDRFAVGWAGGTAGERPRLMPEFHRGFPETLDVSTAGADVMPGVARLCEGGSVRRLRVAATYTQRALNRLESLAGLPLAGLHVILPNPGPGGPPRRAGGLPWVGRLVELATALPALAEFGVTSVPNVGGLLASAASRLTGLRSLALRLSQATAAEASAFEGLRKLDLAGNFITDDDLNGLFRSPAVAGLEVLNLSGNPVGRKGIWYFEAPLLNTLTLRDCDLSGSSSPWPGGGMANLRRLDLSSATLTQGGLRALGTSAFWPRLEFLDLSGSRITPGEFAALPAAPRLRRLSLAQATPRDGLGPLAAWDRCPSLAWLDIGGNRVRSAGLQGLARSPMMGTLERLDAPFCGIDAVGVVALMGRLGTRLRHLDLSGNPLSVHAVRDLADGPAGQWRTLQLKSVSLTRPSVRALCEGPAVSEVRLIRLSPDGLSGADRRLLEDRFGEALKWAT